MLKDINYDKYISKVNEKLKKGGVFLTVEADVPNTMTIGWGFIGYMWGKPIFIVPVRKSRYSHNLIEASNEFTVSVPFENYKKELAYCGSKSGKDTNKFKDLGLTTLKGKVIDTPIIDGCDMYYECKILYKQDMKLEELDIACIDKWYSNNDYHTLYFGEIVACYGKI